MIGMDKEALKKAAVEHLLATWTESQIFGDDEGLSEDEQEVIQLACNKLARMSRSSRDDREAKVRSARGLPPLCGGVGSEPRPGKVKSGPGQPGHRKWLADRGYESHSDYMDDMGHGNGSDK